MTPSYLNVARLLAFVSFIVILGYALGRYASAQPEVALQSLKAISIWSAVALILFPRGQGWLGKSWVVLVLAGLILLYGWFMVLNAKAENNLNQFQFELIEDRLWPGGPGSVAQSPSLRKMLEISGLLLLFFAAVRARQSFHWKFLLAVLPILGAIITLVGIFHRIVDAPGIWFSEEKHPPHYFAPFIYHGNAGSYLNLAGALAFGFLMSAIGKRERSWIVGWGIVTALCFVGVAATASKGAVLIGLIMFVALILVHRKRLLFQWAELKSREIRFSSEQKLIILVITLLVLTMGFVGVERLLVRMDNFIEDASDGSAVTVEGRIGIMRVMAAMASPDEGGWAGFGPGSFSTVVRYFLNNPEYGIRGSWRNGHCDPLQLVTEWGYVGAALWIVFGLGAMWKGIRTIRFRGADASVSLTRSMMVAIASMALHSSFDFPFGIFSLKLSAILVCGFLWGGPGKREALSQRS